MGQGEIVARTYPAGTSTIMYDATANDSDKSFTVPTNKEWKLKSLYAELATTATVGNRVLIAQITSGGNAIFCSRSTASIVASKRGISKICFGSVISSITTLRRILAGTTDCDICIDAGECEITLPAGSVIRIWDVAAVDAAADDMIVVLHYEELDV